MKKIEIEWKGETFFIGEDRWFAVAEEVEEVITLIDIHEISIRPRLTKIARAYSIMINFAGGESTPAEVHRDLTKQIGGASKSGKVPKTIAANAIMVLAQVILGGAQDVDPGTEASDGEKKPRRKRVRRS